MKDIWKVQSYESKLISLVITISRLGTLTNANALAESNNLVLK